MHNLKLLYELSVKTGAKIGVKTKIQLIPGDFVVC